MELITNIFTTVMVSMTVIYTLHMFMTTSSDVNEYWYDFMNSYYTFSEKHTEAIDTLLIKQKQNQKQNQKLNQNMNIIVNENNMIAPDFGNYEYQFTKDNKCKIWLIKMIVKKDSKEKIIYKAYTKKHHQSRLDEFVAELNKLNNDNLVVVTSIDTSLDVPTTIQLKKLCLKPKPNQLKVLDIIMESYNEANFYNVKVILTGDRGIGKTYLGRLLKKHLDKIVGVNSILYDDFNPSSVGVNINHALKYASSSMPVIIVINEIDVFFEQVLNSKESYDARLQHTKNKSEFHNMLDAIGSSSHVILIATTQEHMKMQAIA